MARGVIVVTGDGRLDRSGTIVLDAAGHGFLELGPVPPGQVWAITRYTVSCNADDPMPVCNVYDGPIAPGNLLDATWTGSRDTSDFGTPYILPEMESLTFEWVGGLPGAEATARLVGTQQSA